MRRHCRRDIRRWRPCRGEQRHVTTKLITWAEAPSSDCSPIAASYVDITQLCSSAPAVGSSNPACKPGARWRWAPLGAWNTGSTVMYSSRFLGTDGMKLKPLFKPHATPPTPEIPILPFPIAGFYS